MATLLERLHEDMKILQDELSVEMTFKHWTSNTFDPATGTVTPNYTDDPVKVIRDPLTVSEVALGGGKFEMGDVRFFIPKKTASGDPEELGYPMLWPEPKMTDLIVDGSETFRVIAWELDPIKEMCLVIGRKL